MNTKLMVWSGWCLLFGLCSGWGAATESLVERNNAFAFELYQSLGNTPGNLIASPFSLSVSMSMVHAGASGETARQISETMHFTGLDTGAAFHEFILHLKAMEEKASVQLRSAQSLWVDKSYAFREPFLNALKTYYFSELQPVDFMADAETARTEINAWVEQQTQDKIRNLLPPGTLNAMIRLVLVNAVYFKSQWAHPFDPSLTREMPFTIVPDEETNVMMMSRQGDYLYAEDDEAQWLELLYANQDLSMVILLPKATNGLSGVESKLTFAYFEDGLKKLHSRDVQVLMPRFKIVSSFVLNDVLQSMGVTEAFHVQKADFSGMSKRPGLWMSDVIHKVFVEVNEEGTEAAAATGAIMSLTSVPASPVVFQADRPFVFLIRERGQGGILFMGRVSDPTRLAAD